MPPGLGDPGNGFLLQGSSPPSLLLIVLLVVSLRSSASLCMRVYTSLCVPVMHCRLPYEGPRRISSNAAGVIEVAPRSELRPYFRRAWNRKRKFGRTRYCSWGKKCDFITSLRRVRLPADVAESRHKPSPHERESAWAISFARCRECTALKS